MRVHRWCQAQAGKRPTAAALLHSPSKTLHISRGQSSPRDAFRLTVSVDTPCAVLY